ncbi:MAG: uracil-DNA glycosylase [SAR202 cluster bacterium]|jgi:DNA polymerase|nr:uracil-DNA glycosylase [SAR202 cluster bacterium]
MSAFDDLVLEIKACTLCPLSEGRIQAVPGEGSRTADIMFIGEGPGFYEDRDGRPFIGPAGKLLDEMLATIGLNRGDVYITNMVKCRPPQNRDPLPAETGACQPYLDRQLEIISPKVVATLGRFSFGKFFPSESISKARGKPRRWRDLTVYPMYHPAAALHNPRLRPAIENDFRRLPSLIESASRAPEEPEQAAKARQLSMFEQL